MNATALQSSSRKVTDVIAIYDAGSFAPCRVDDKLVLHVSTTSGEVVIRCSERAFVQGCRGPVDGNGKPFRDLQLVDVDRRRADEAAALPPPAPKVIVSRATLTADRVKLYEEVYAISLTDYPWGAIAAACRERGITQEAFSAWRSNHKRKPDSNP